MKSLLIVILVLTVTSYSPTVMTHSDPMESTKIQPPRALVDEITRQPVLAGIDPELLRIVQLNILALDCPAVRVEVLNRIPTRELVFVKVGEEWRLSLSDKSLVAGWRKIASTCLRRVAQNACSISAESVARDLAFYFVDPDGKYGVVLSSADSVPINYESSDMLRDLQRSGLDPVEIKKTLVPQVLEVVRPPNLECTNQSTKLTFFTWHYFGGEVVSWRVTLSPMVTIRRRRLASHVGSRDHYY
jgi:hypothetical protein